MKRVVLLSLLLVACAPPEGLRLAPERAEFPRGNPVVVDGQLGADEWQYARRTSVRLTDGRTVEVFFQRDERSFAFAFTGLDQRGYPTVLPQILLDTWADGGRTWRDEDWWFEVGNEDCQARGHLGDEGANCAREQLGWVANNFPLGLGQAVEVTVDFRTLGMSENYQDLIGLAFRFVRPDENGDPDEEAIWPLGARAEWPESWSRLSLVH